jgi:CxxC motif-containing protein (DUF1111 family)
MRIMQAPWRGWLLALMFAAGLGRAPVRGADVANGPATAQSPAERGRQLFQRVWQANDPLAGGDGLGPMYNGTSCAACHYLGGIGGAGAAEQNVQLLTAQPPPRPAANFRTKLEAVHPLFFGGLGTASSIMLHRASTTADYADWRGKFSRDLPAGSAKPRRRVRAGGLTFSLSERSSPALFGAGLIDQVPAAALEQLAADQRRGTPDTAGRVPRAGFDVGRFGWRGQTGSLDEFVRMACAVELGLEVPGHAQERNPLEPGYRPPGFDLTSEQTEELAAFVASLPAPREALPAEPARRAAAVAGKAVFRAVGCADCHTENVGPVRGLYSDLLLHDLGSGLEAPVPPNADTPGFAFASFRGDAPARFAGFAQQFERGIPAGGFPVNGLTPQSFFNSYLGAVNDLFATPGRTSEWRTPPLWGVADSAPYLHDGRAADLETAILLHDGQARRARNLFQRSSVAQKAELLEFLGTLRAPQQ